MTDKPIMIDDVDVSECIYYADGKCTNSQMIQSNCKNVAVCYYKEYRRKEQECERLKNIINEAKNSKLDLKSFLVGEAIQNEYEQQLDKLKEENEQLKKSVRSNKDKRKRAIEKYLKLKEFTNKEFEKLKAELKDMTIRKIDYLKESLTYKQALQEIKKIAEDDCKTCTVKLLGEDEINCKRCYKTKILQKCEVIDE